MSKNNNTFPEYIEIIKGVAEAWNGQDVERLLSYLDEDIYWDDPPMEVPARGHEMVKDFALSLWQAFPDMRYIPLQDIFLSPDQPKIAHKFTISGTMLGQMPPGFAPTGRYLEIDGYEMFQFRKKKVHRLISRFDGIRASEQLGLLPPRLKTGSRKARIAVFFQRPIAWCQRRFPPS